MEIETAQAPPARTWSLFALLMAATLIASGAMTPALMFLLAPERQAIFTNDPIDPTAFVFAFVITNLFVSGVAIAIGLRLESRVGMGVALLRASLGGEATWAAAGTITLRCLAVGVVLAVVVLSCGLVFRSQLPELPAGFAFPPIWQGSLLLLGAAVREEILFRLFALNLCTWIGMKLFRRKQPTPQLIWAANVLTAFAFAVLHLVPASQMLALNPSAMALVLVLATVAGTVFGYIYWRYDLVMAVLSHAVAGLVLYLGVRGALAFNE